MFNTVYAFIGKFSALPQLVHKLYRVLTNMGLREGYVEHFDPSGMFVHLREIS